MSLEHMLNKIVNNYLTIFDLFYLSLFYKYLLSNY